MSPIPVAEPNPRYITRRQLHDWLDQIASETKLVAPRDVDGFILYRRIHHAEDIVLDYSKPVLSIKDAFFPPSEELFSIQMSDAEMVIEESTAPGEQILFGVRPCDAFGQQALDAVFLTTEPSDSYYQRRRESSVLVGIACREMGPTCFCTAMGTAPDDWRYMDVMLTEIDGGYSLAAITNKGHRLLDRYGLELDDMPTRRSKHRQYPDIQLIPPTSERWIQHFDDPFWEQTAERCLSCRACAYVCPTCRCFDVRDEQLSGQGADQIFARIRCWDSCTRDAYRRIAGGHNPRSEKGRRLRNRFYCKYHYFPLQYGPTACTGCGRCIDVCPVGVDITEIVQHIAGSVLHKQENLLEVDAR